MKGIKLNFIKKDDVYIHFKSEYINPHDLIVKDLIEELNNREYQVYILKGAHGWYLDIQGRINNIKPRINNFLYKD